jgi:hypothetical protein
LEGYLTGLIEVGNDLRDDTWSRSGGTIQNKFRDLSIATIRLDLSELCWADPAPLLSLACLCAEFRNRDGDLTINLGQPNQKNYQFLIFFAQHGFLSILAKHSKIIWANRYRNDLDSLINELRDLPGALAYQDAECLSAHIFSLKELEYDKIDGLIEDLIDLAHPRIASWLPGNSRRRGLVTHQLRVFLSESLDNIAEHAYRNSAGYGAVYARIRAGTPDERAAREAWTDAKRREGRHCPALGRCRAGKRPGWLELFVCDVGVGLTHELSQDSHAPLLVLSNRLFREGLSRIPDRLAAGKTDMTGLQRIGHLLGASASKSGQGDFVRIFCNGEWVGEHLPWPDKKYQPGHGNIARIRDSQSPLGTLLHFSIEPPPAEAEQQSKLYPKSFVAPSFQNLEEVRNEFARQYSREIHSNIIFYDFYKRTTFSRHIDTIKQDTDTNGTIVYIRPRRHQRKIDLVNQIKNLTSRPIPPSDILYIDMPWSLAIDFFNIIIDERSWKSHISANITVTLLSQDWFCTCLSYNFSSNKFHPSGSIAHKFLTSPSSTTSAAQAASILRRQDSLLFWIAAVPAYINEHIAWQSTDEPTSAESVKGYLDIGFALAQPSIYGIARRAMRRALTSLIPKKVHAADDIIARVLTADFVLSEDLYAQSATNEPTAVLAGSVLGSGNTTKRLLRGSLARYVGTAQLLRHPDFPPDASLPRLLALDWTPHRPKTLRRASRPFERVANTPLVIRGGESAVPLPRFAEPKNGKRGRSLYGENPNQAYQRWQRLGLLRLGHWTYGLNHDLLTLRLEDALVYDAVEGGIITNWLAAQIREWIPVRENLRRGFVVYTQHAINERLVRAVSRHHFGDGIQFYPAAAAASHRQAALILSPMTREAIIEKCSSMMIEGGSVVILDDAVISGATMRTIEQALRGVWEGLRQTKRIRSQAELQVHTLAVVDRSGEPAQRALVERNLNRDRRYWRWDVPSLGHAGTCPLCALHSRWKSLESSVHGSLLQSRLKQWLTQWEATPVEQGRFDAGVPARRVFGEISTRFGIERNIEPHRVSHFLAVSRVSISAEISRATTRKDYPLRKSREGLDSSDHCDLQTSIEILSTQLLLFPDDLSAPDRIERLELILDLIWRSESATISTALAGMVSLIDNLLVDEIWKYCVILIDAHGFPHEDCILVALVLYRSSSLQNHPPLKSGTAWEIFDLCRRSSGDGRQALAMVLRVFGWSPQSIHRTALPDSLEKSSSDSEFSQAVLMLERLAQGIRGIPIAAIENSGLNSVEDGKILDQIVASIKELQNHQQTLIESRTISHHSQSIRRQLHKAWQLLFGHHGLQFKYMSTLTTELRNEDASRELLTLPWSDVQRAWDKLVSEKLSSDKIIPSVPFPTFEPAIGIVRPINLYFDQTIRRAVVDLMSNVIHRDRAIACPWPEGSRTPEADLWGRLRISDDGDRVEIELVNGYAGGDSVRPRMTPSLAHLYSIGGHRDIASDQKRRLVFTKIFIPTAAGLTRS